MSQLNLSPIGYLHTSQDKKYQLKPQPKAGEPGGVVELMTGQNYEVALRDLEGFDRIWLVWWFHKNQNWRPTTLPPRGRSGRKGTFATRSPYRPNPIGLSNVELLKIEGNRLIIGAHDLLDETPILDIKPYMPEFDSFPDAASGWYGEMEKDLEERPTFEVEFDSEPDSAELRQRIVEILSQDPMPHRTRRIINFDGGFRLSCGDWRVFYQVEERVVKVRSLRIRD